MVPREYSLKIETGVLLTDMMHSCLGLVHHLRVPVGVQKYND